jgi:hypothetical protein
MADLTTNKKEDFIQKNKGLRSETDTKAQQLINIYRQLSVLGDEATLRYNEKLLKEADPTILNAMHYIPGGDEVRDYYHFLTHTDNENENDKNADTGSATDILPSSEQLSPIWEMFGCNAVQTFMNPVNTEKTVVENLNLSAFEQNLEQALTKQKQSIINALNFIVFDPDIEKTKQNVRNSAAQIMQALNNFKEVLSKEISEIKEQTMQRPQATNGYLSEEKSYSVKKPDLNLDKFRKNKIGPKFSVDITEEE